MTRTNRSFGPASAGRSLKLALILSLASSGMGSSFALAQSTKSAKPGPAIEISPDVFDFGGVAQDQRLEHVFIIENIGTEPLEIRRISTSCGCAAAVPDSRIVEPRASTRLVVTLETRKYKGVIEKSISVASNDPGRIRTIKVQAFVEVPES